MLYNYRIVESQDFSTSEVITLPIIAPDSVEYFYYANAIGKISVTYPVSLLSQKQLTGTPDEQFLSIGSFIEEKSTKHLFLILRRTIDLKKNVITVQGLSANCLLNYRSFRYDNSATDDTGSISIINETFLNMLLNYAFNVPYRLVDFENSGSIIAGPVYPFHADISWQIDGPLPLITEPLRISGGPLLDQIIKITDSIGFCNRMELNDTKKQAVFYIYPGTDQSQKTALSDLNGLAQNFKLDDDASLVRNIVTYPARIPGYNYDRTFMYPRRIPVPSTPLIPLMHGVLEYNSEDRIDFNQYGTAGSGIQYERIASSEYAPTLQKMSRRQTVTFDVSERIWSLGYKLGDIVTVQCSQIGYEEAKVLAGVHYTYDSYGEAWEPIIGDVSANLSQRLQFGLKEV